MEIDKGQVSVKRSVELKKPTAPRE